MEHLQKIDTKYIDTYLFSINNQIKFLLQVKQSTTQLLQYSYTLACSHRISRYLKKIFKKKTLISFIPLINSAVS